MGGKVGEGRAGKGEGWEGRGRDERGGGSFAPLSKIPGSAPVSPHSAVTSCLLLSLEDTSSNSFTRNYCCRARENDSYFGHVNRSYLLTCRKHLLRGS